MRIHQITDLHVPDSDEEERFAHVRSNVQRQLDFVASDESDLLVICGDLTMEDGSRFGCEWIRERLPVIPVRILPGNHDDPEVLWSVFGPDYCVNPTFCFNEDALGWDLMFVNSSADEVPEEQLAFISGHPRGRPAALFLHHPPYPVGGGFMAKNQPLINQEDVAEAVRAGGIKHVFCGHYHNRADLACDGFQLHLSPSPAFQIDLESESFSPQQFQPAVRRILINDAVLSTTLVDV